MSLTLLIPLFTNIVAAGFFGRSERSVMVGSPSSIFRSFLVFIVFVFSFRLYFVKNKKPSWAQKLIHRILFFFVLFSIFRYAAPRTRSERTKVAVVMLEFAPIFCIYLVISPLVSLISLGVPFPLASKSSTYPEILSALHFRLVMGILEKEPIVRVALSIAFGVYAVSSICWMFAGGIGDAIVPFLTRNGNPDPGLPPSSSGEPIMGLLLTENHRHDEMSTTLLEIPSVAEEEIWAAVDLQEQPVISDAERREILEQKLRNHGRNPGTRIGEELLEKQMLLEKTLEKHLLRHKYTTKRIRRAFPEFREKLFYFRGKPRKIPELAGWIDEMEGNFLSSSPYRLIIHLQILFTPQELNVKE